MTTMQMTVPQAAEIQTEVTATSPDEMSQAQSGMVAWFEQKVKECEDERKEASDAYNYAIRQKWSTSSLKRIADLAMKRLTFYRKILAALREGYMIIPNFPVRAFAIRTDKKSPLKMLSTNRWSTHEQDSPAHPVGEGQYQNPFPEQWQRTIEKETQTTSAKKEYWAEAWKDLEFPVTMSKPFIMEATTRAMALKIFDDLAILPDNRPGDPMIVARIFDASGNHKGQWRNHVTFLVAWHIDLRTI